VNLPGFIISLAVFLYTARLTYEAWFIPQRFTRRLDAQRNVFMALFGFSHWKNGYINWSLVKVVSIVILLISLIGIVFSITGPIIIRR